MTTEPREIEPTKHKLCRDKISSLETQLTQQKALIVELVEGYKLIIKSDCCPKVPLHGNTCPKWIAEEALATARSMGLGEK